MGSTRNRLSDERGILYELYAAPAAALLLAVTGLARLKSQPALGRTLIALGAALMLFTVYAYFRSRR